MVCQVEFTVVNFLLHIQIQTYSSFFFEEPAVNAYNATDDYNDHEVKSGEENAQYSSR